MVGLTSDAMPTLWGFMDFNYTSSTASEASHAIDDGDGSKAGESTEEPKEEPKEDSAAKPVLTPAEWQYPDDCFYIKMYVVCPLQPLQEAFGPCHGYGDEKRGGMWGDPNH